jgi:protein-export membrane protein, SecD/SecF family
MSVNVNTVITDGAAIIQSSNGGYSYEQAYELVTRLQAGTFGVDLTSREPNIVSPTLGDNAIKNSLIAGAIGLALVMIFMFVIYRNLGLMADIALLIYIELLLILCSVLPWVQLTLPGIAGIVLGIGMAVDANIVIFERMKDEFRDSVNDNPDLFSKPIRGADGRVTSQGGIFARGFRKAVIAVVDANVTTIIGAIVLWIFGGQAVIGFAVTLLISIVISMFTAIVVTRGLIYALQGFAGSDNPALYGFKKKAKKEISSELAVEEGK